MFRNLSICQTDSLTYRLFLIGWYGLESLTTHPYNITGKIKYVYQQFRFRYKIGNLIHASSWCFRIYNQFFYYIFLYIRAQKLHFKKSKNVCTQGAVNHPPINISWNFMSFCVGRFWACLLWGIECEVVSSRFVSLKRSISRFKLWRLNHIIHRLNLVISLLVWQNLHWTSFWGVAFMYCWLLMVRIYVFRICRETSCHSWPLCTIG